jgi:hypothetical protein
MCATSVRDFNASLLEHDPEKWKPVFRRIMLSKTLERNGNSLKVVPPQRRNRRDKGAMGRNRETMRGAAVLRWRPPCR